MVKFDDITTKALSLPLDNRAELAELLIQSVNEEDGEQVKSDWIAEIRRRDQEIREGKAVTKPAAQALREARELLRCTT